MKKTVALLTTLLVILGLCVAVHAEISIPVPEAISFRPSMEKAVGRNSSVVPFAAVSWGDNAETVAAAASGEIGERDGTAVVTASVQIEGISNEVPVTYFFDEGGLCRVEAVAAEHLNARINDLSASAAGQALITQTEAFFKGEDCSNRHGDGLEIYMSPNTTAGLRCRGVEKDWHLSVVYYPPDPFDTGMVEAAEGISRLEDGQDMVYFPGSIKYVAAVNVDSTEIGLSYMIRVGEYQLESSRIPSFTLIAYCRNNEDPGEGQSLAFLIDGKQYTFTGIRTAPGSSSGGKIMTYSATMGEHCLDFWEALSLTENPVRFTFSTLPEGKGTYTLSFDLLDETVARLTNGYRMYRDAHGLSGIALDYASVSESPMAVQVWEDITSAVPEFTLDSSAVPFTEISWDAKLNNLSKSLGVKAEKSGNASILRSAVSIDGLGNNLPVTYTFRNNKLVSVRLMITQGFGYDAGYRESAKGKLIDHYIQSFIGSHPHQTYSSQASQFVYTITDVTEIACGLLRNGSSYDLSMEFFPAQKYDVSALKKNKKISSFPSEESNVVYYDSEPFFFEHSYTYQGNRFTYSYFMWCLMMREAGREIGKIPVLYYGFIYNGVKNPSSAKWLSFTIDNDVYRFELRDSEKEALTKTQYGELSQTFKFQIDCDNYVFLEKLAKGKKVEVALQGDSFMLNFSLPAKAKQQMVEGMKYFEKVCGIVDGPLAFNRFSGTPVTIY